MQTAKGSGKASAQSKAGEKRRVVLSGRPIFAVAAGLALAASLAVLAVLLFGPVPALPPDHVVSSVVKAGDSRQAAAAQGNPRGGRKGPHASPRAPLPFEEHLAPRETSPGGIGGNPEVRARVEPAAPPLPATQPTPAVDGSQPQPAAGDAGKGPRMVVIIDDIGDHPALAENLTELPFPVALAILPSRPRTRAIEAMAAARGTEILLHQPMQPGAYPRVNPGPGALFTDMDAARIQAIVADNLAQAPHAIGINNHMGSAFTSFPEGMEAVMQVLREKGLFFLDSVTSAVSAGAEAARKSGVPFYRRAVFLDNVRNTRAILGQLKTAERHAVRHGRAIAIGHPYGETLEALKIWARERDSHVAVVTLKELGPEF